MAGLAGDFYPPPYNFTLTPAQSNWQEVTERLLRPMPTPNAVPEKEEPNMAMDNEITSSLNAAREARHAAIRKMQRLRDEATLLRIDAAAKDSQADLMLSELNEQVPEPEDPER